MLTIFPFRSLLLTLPHLVPKIKNAFYFGPYYHLTNENCLHGKQCTVGTLNADMIIKIILKIIILRVRLAGGVKKWEDRKKF